MENASKALIIAGAILLSILIIGLGMGVYNSAKSNSGDQELDSEQIRAHNSKFLQYEGKQKGDTVNSLITAIKTNNEKYKDRMITITDNSTLKKGSSGFKGITATAINATEDPNNGKYDGIRTNIKANTTYYVTFKDADNGCIGGCEIHIWSTED